MESSLDTPLDDMIKNRVRGERGRGRGRSRRGQRRGTVSFGNAAGRLPKGPLRVNAHSSAYAIAKSFNRNRNVPWQRGLLQDGLIAAGYSGIEAGGKLYVSNLDHGVSNEDIKELFSEIGPLKHYTLHYDKNGRSNGSAEVVFSRSADALAAMKRYDNVQLDGKNMKIELIGTKLEVPLSARVNVIGGANGRGRRTVVMTPGMGRQRTSVPVNRNFNMMNQSNFQRGNFQQRGLGRGRGNGQVRGRGFGRGQGQVRGRKAPIEKSANELDEELETYHAEAMNTS